MEQKKIVSVLTPVYNRKELIGRLYKSLLGQTKQNFIWVIIDDGSKGSLEQEVEDDGSIPDHLSLQGKRWKAHSFEYGISISGYRIDFYC